MGSDLIGTSEVPPENVFEGLYRNISQGSKQLQTVFAMYNQELSRDRLPSKLSTQHTDQTMRTRKFKARNERIETRMLVRSQKGRDVSGERKVGECFHWKANGQCSRGDCCSLSHTSHSGERARAPTQTDERKPYILCNLRER